MSHATGTFMRAALQTQYGEASTVHYGECAVPTADKNRVVIAVEAAALNPADVFAMRGKPFVMKLAGGLTKPRQPVRGTDVAGTIVALGEGVTGWQVGDRVFGAASGSLAQYASARTDNLCVLPDGVDATSGAASVMAGLAAVQGLRAAHLDPYPEDAYSPQALDGRRILIVGAAGGIGSFLIQMAAQAGAEVTAVCSPEGAEKIRHLGATHIVDYTQQDVLSLTSKFHLVFDNAGVTPMLQLEKLTTQDGIVIPNSGSPGPDGGAIRRVLKALWRGKIGKHRIAIFYSSPQAKDLQIISRELAAKRLVPLVDSTWTLEDASTALARVASHHAHGKVVITP